ncbi:MAG: tRNA (adenosine(37)-N6)-dimethylallyltransferase MiaA [Micrococcales bacterium]|nr:tRNA (adenosine(37)-N6)-dimethylallyltransferase MiaA [Micrococcales bacterium]
MTGPPQLVSIVGPTGTGKSDLALDLATALRERRRPAAIGNADAMQLYRGMDIGTAKVPPTERRGIRHHLLDVLEPREEASVARYQTAAREAIEDIRTRGAVPILVGGSGLYVSSVVYDFSFPGTDAGVRLRLEEELARSGAGRLHTRLREVDPAAAAAIGPHNGRRLVRALEVIEISGRRFGSGLPAEARTWLPTLTLGLRQSREQLVPRLDARVERMWTAGLVDEVAALRPAGLGVTAARAIGYAQALAQLDGAIGERAAIEQTQALTRRYARRQVSWFRRYAATRWIDADAPAADRLATALEGLSTASGAAR